MTNGGDIKPEDMMAINMLAKDTTGRGKQLASLVAMGGLDAKDAMAYGMISNMKQNQNAQAAQRAPVLQKEHTHKEDQIVTPVSMPAPTELAHAKDHTLLYFIIVL